MKMIDILCAVGLDLIIGDPPDFPHPVKLMGNIIAAEEKLIRRYAKNRKVLLVGGLLLVITNLCLFFFVPYLLLTLLQAYPSLTHIVKIYLLYTCLAARCLRDEALKIYMALEQSIEEARTKVAFIVGRDTKHLNESEIIRATVETVAENTADTIIAPLFYAIIGGIPLALVYKMVNTMDSMLGYMNTKYRDIGFFPAKVDDVFNYLPARITGLLMNMGSVYRFQVLNGFKIMIRDHNNHKSPNCAYPEGAVAGLLGVQLGGDNVYFGQVIKKPTIGDSKRALVREDIPRAVEIMFRTELVFIGLYILVFGVMN